MRTATFVNLCHAATDRLWMHRKALRRVAVRIGFCPDGLVISARVSRLSEDREENGIDTAPARLSMSPSPHTIPWDEVHTLTEEALVKIVDDYCSPLYALLGVKQGG